MPLNRVVTEGTYEMGSYVLFWDGYSVVGWYVYSTYAKLPHSQTNFPPLQPNFLHSMYPPVHLLQKLWFRQK